MYYFKMLWYLCFVAFSPNCGTITAEEKAQVEASAATTQIQNLAEKKVNISTDSTISLDYLMGKFDPEKHSDFVKVDQAHASKTDFYLRKDAYAAFIKMYEAAKKEGIQLQIISATRPFAHQKRIWETKWNGSKKVDGQDISKTIKNPVDRALKILEYSSMPGTSRHHWGTDVDLNALTNDYFEKGKGLKEYEWLDKHASQFGFCQPYSEKGYDRPEGYNEEKWHWSYLPFAKKLTDQYKLRVKDESISGFEGSDTAPKIGVVKKYVLGVSRECL